MSNHLKLDWDNIDTVLLDMDGTLLDLHYDNHFWFTHLPKRYAEIHGGDIDQVRMMLHRKIMAKKGSQQWYDLTYWSDELNVDINALKCETQSLVKTLPYTHGFLDKMQAMNKELYIVTNAHIDGVEIKLGQVDIARYFKRIVIAFEYHRPKEDTEFWPLLHADLGYDPTRTLFVDDNADVLQAAQNAGIGHVIGLRCPDSTNTRNDLMGVHHVVDNLAGITP